MIEISEAIVVRDPNRGYNNIVYNVAAACLPSESRIFIIIPSVHSRAHINTRTIAEQTYVLMRAEDVCSKSYRAI